MRRVSPCAERPNDNRLLHLGAIWVVVEPCGEPHAELPEKAPEPTLALHEEDDAIERIEIVDELDFSTMVAQDTTELVPPPPRDSGIVAIAMETFPAEVRGAEEISAEAAPYESTLPPQEQDPFAFFVQALTDVALAHDGVEAAASVSAILGGERIHLAPSISDRMGGATFVSVAEAWRRVIRGEGDDFSVCGATPLDEWAAALLAALMSAQGKADLLRRELRKRGVAAFGVVLEAA